VIGNQFNSESVSRFAVWLPVRAKRKRVNREISLDAQSGVARDDRHDGNMR
jgi:hypothetical protein